MTASRSIGGVRTKNATRSLAGAGTTIAASAKAKAATGAGASIGRAKENLKAEARSRHDPLAGLPHHHLAVAAEVEAEATAGDLALAHNLLAMARATHGTALTNTEPTTLVRSALAG